MNKKPGRGSDQFPLRFPDGMRDRIKALADKNSRSMNAEIISLIADGFEYREQQEWLNRPAMTREEQMAFEADLRHVSDTLKANENETARRLEIQQLHEAVIALQKTVAEGRRHFEEVEKPVLAEALVMNRVIHHIAREGADDEVINLLRQVIQEDAGSFERVVSKLTGQPVSETLGKVVERLAETAKKST